MSGKKTASKKVVRGSGKSKSAVKKTVKKSDAIKPGIQEIEPAQQEPVIVPAPTAGKKVQDFEDILDKQLAGDMGPTKRPVGRPPKKEEVEPEPPELTIEIVAGVVKIPFELWSISQSVKSLALSDDEAKSIAEPARQLLEHYLPQIPVIAYAWISMSVSVFWVMQSRLRTIQELRKHRERIRKETQPAPTAPAQPGVSTKFPEKNTPVKI